MRSDARLSLVVLYEAAHETSSKDRPSREQHFELWKWVHTNGAFPHQTALEFAQNGTAVVVADVDEEGGAETVQQIENRYSQGGLGNPKAIATAVLWLCSDAASFRMVKHSQSTVATEV